MAPLFGRGALHLRRLYDETWDDLIGYRHWHGYALLARRSELGFSGYTLLDIFIMAQ